MVHSHNGLDATVLIYLGISMSLSFVYFHLDRELIFISVCLHRFVRQSVLPADRQMLGFNMNTVQISLLPSSLDIDSIENRLCLSK